VTGPARRTYADDAVHLTDLFPVPDATPSADCGRCAELAEKRTAARAAGDYSAVSDANVLIRRHPH
jgi:hypothetical protein